MSAIENLLMQPEAQAIGWALLHFVWQGALIGIITASALAMLRRSAADVRYVVATIGLSLMLTMPIVSVVQSWPAAQRAAVSDVASARAQAFTAGSLPAVEGATGSTVSQQPSAPLPAAKNTIAAASLGPWIPTILFVWLLGVSVLSLRLLSAWLWVNRMKSHGTRPASFTLQEIAARLTRSLHVARTVRFLESTLVEVPTVIGWLKPVVLIPASALVALTPQQLEAVIAHELAHIRRHDYLVNLLQTLVETLLFYHPAVWWLSRRIRVERENCCDDLAVSLCGDAITYARALADLEELRGSGGLALAASGGSLLQRVRRLLCAPPHAGRGPGWLAGSAAVLLMAGIAAGAVGSAALSAGQQSSGAQPAVAAQTPAAPNQATPVVAPAVKAPVTPQPATQALEATAAQIHALEMAQRAQTVGTAMATSARALEAEAQTVAATAQQATTMVAEAQGTVSEALAAVAAMAPVVANMATTLSRSSQEDSQRGNWVWSDGKEKLEVNYSGAIEFTDDDTDVKRLSPGGWLKIKEGGLRGSRTVEFKADASGNLERRFWVGTSERPFDPEGRQWLTQTMPRFIRQSGLGAPARVARIFRIKGVDGVLAEIALVEGSWAKRVYFSELLKAGTLEPRAIEQILTRAGRDLDSDFELASLLIASADRTLVDDATRRAYFDAVRSIESDFEMRRVYSAALKRGPVSSDLLTALLEASSSIESDFEAAALLTQVLKQQTINGPSRPAFFKALAEVESDFEHRRVLNALASQTDIDANTVKEILDSGVQLDSDFELAGLLMTVLKHHSIENVPRASFFRAVDTLDSGFERARVLQAVARRSDASAETILGVLRATKTMGSDFETGQVLTALAAAHPLKGEARDLYIDIAEKLGDFEQGRALSALVRNERGKR